MDRMPVNRMLGGAMLALGLIGAQTLRADVKKMTIVRPLKVGAVTTYKAAIKANVQGMDVELDQSEKQTIKSIKDNGDVVILSEELGGTLKFNGQESEQKAGPPSTETRDKLGKLIDFATEADPNAPFAPEVQKLMTGIGELILTDKEVGEGDSWDTLLDNPASKDNKAKVKTTYQGIEKVDGVDLWKFKQTAEAVVNADGSKLTGDSIIWVNPKDGQMEKMEAQMKSVPTQLGPMDISMTVHREKPTADAKPLK